MDQRPVRFCSRTLVYPVLATLVRMRAVHVYILLTCLVPFSRYFSESTAVLVPPYVIARDPKYFSPAPDSFWPDRWLPSPSPSTLPPSVSDNEKNAPIINNTSAFIPFSFGLGNCSGKGLALMEMRMVVTLLLQRFEMRFADGFDARMWEQHLEDFYVLANGELPVILTART